MSEDNVCKFCNEPVQWVTARVGHGPHFRYKLMPISAQPDKDGLVISYQEEFQVKRRNEIHKTPENKRFLSHGYVPCVAQRNGTLRNRNKNVI